ncbi:hypothetical protein GJ698_07105 [Pseudoduganella sp. FT26W]|uniref:Lipoprotein n=1 Tax=Duganella aquatilis TaxID=2666082 RepID=A0A844CU30_9BURK|nr:hypothetical protein [Duganella aquatilis]MRW83863.1 hypothetical protein [Duganella aquatilis]
MNISRFFPILTSLIFLTACTTTSTIKLYDGADREPSQIATLFIDPHVVVTRVDSITEHPNDESRDLAHSAGKRREAIALAPGRHELNSRFFVLCLQSVGDFPLQFTAEAGKKYRLKSVVDVEHKRWKPEIVEYDGGEIEDTFPWTQAMCKVQVNIIRLGR